MTTMTVKLDQIDAPPARNYRKTYEAEKLQELAASIKVKGILQRPIVRKSPTKPNRYELAVGGRRFRAAEIAGLTEIEVDVRDLDDAEVLEAQLIENHHREDVPPLEEADGYSKLLKLRGTTVADIAARVGRSETTVLRRVKLANLCPEGRSLLDDQLLGLDGAHELACMPSLKMQEEALAELKKRFPWATNPDNPDGFSGQQVRQFVRARYHLPLSKAPFAVDDADLVAKAGPCTTCPKNTGVQRGLFDDVEGEVCIDVVCYGEKRDAGFAKLAEQAKNDGGRVLSKEEAAKLFQLNEYTGVAYLRSQDRYVALDSTCSEGSYNSPWHGKTWRKALGTELGKPVLAQAPDGQIFELLPRKEALAALGSAHPKSKINRPEKKKSSPATSTKPGKPSASSAPSPATEAKRAEARAAEEAKQKAKELDRKIIAEVAARAYEAVILTAEKKPTVIALRTLIESVSQDLGLGEAAKHYKVRYGEHTAKDLAKLTEAQLRGFAAGMAILTEADPWMSSLDDLEDTDVVRVAKVYGIDVAAIEKDVRAKLAPKADAKATAAKKPAKKKSKAKA